MSPRRGQGLLALLMFALVSLCGRLIWIHAHDGARLAAYAARQQRSTVPLAARRGMIVDCRGRIMAGTQLQQSVFADPKIIPDRPAAARLVAEVLGSDQLEIEGDLVAAQDRRFFILARNVTEEQARRIRDANMPGIGVFDQPGRTYPMHTVAAPLLGFVAPDGHGVNAAEHQFEPWLAGRTGYKTVVRDARRRAFWLSGDGFQPPADGLHVVLTIDSVIQERVERILADAMARYDAQSGVAIVMRPGNGEILALANVPGFDPNDYRDYAPSRYRNRAITDPVEPGSIFKPFVAAAALAERVVKLTDVIDCHRGLLVDGQRMLHDHHPYGDLSFLDVMVKSSNIGMALVGKRLGNEKMHQYLTAFGFGQRTGVGLEGEDSGIMLPLHRWTSFSTMSLPMGQEIALTPIQVLRAFWAFANGGRLVRPQIVRAILEGEDRVVRDFVHTNEPSPRVIPESVVAQVKDQMLVDAVNRGTGVNADLVGYQVFGKTGTAQIARKGGGGYEPRAYISSFMGGAPAAAPQVVVLVLITRPNAAKAYYGGTVAAPVAGDILGFTLAYLGVPPDASIHPAKPTTVAADR